MTLLSDILGTGGLFEAAPFKPVVNASNIDIGSSVDSGTGFPLILNGTSIVKALTAIDPTNPGLVSYVAGEYYSGVVYYDVAADSFQIVYSDASYVDSATALNNVPSYDIIGAYEVCHFSEQVLTLAIGTTEKTFQITPGVLPIVWNEYTGHSTTVVNSGTVTGWPGSFNNTGDVAVSHANNTFAVSDYQQPGYRNVIHIFNLTTGAWISTVTSTASGGFNINSWFAGPGICYDSAADEYVMFGFDDFNNHLITRHNPLTGAENSFSTGFSGIPTKTAVYLPAPFDTYIGTDGGAFPPDIYELDDIGGSTLLISQSYSSPKLSYDPDNQELWVYDQDSTNIEVYSVTSGPLALTFDRNETGPEVDFDTHLKNYTESGNVVDTTGAIEIVDTRKILAQQNAVGPYPLIAPSDTTISDENTFSDVLIRGDLTVDSATVIVGDLNVEGALTINAPLTVDGNVKAFSVDVQTPNSFDFDVKGSIIAGSHTDDVAADLITGSKFFNVGGDLIVLSEAGEIRLEIDEDNSSELEMRVGGDIRCETFWFIINDDGVTASPVHHTLKVKGNIITKTGTQIRSEHVDANRQIANTAHLYVEGDINGGITMFGGFNNDAGGSAIGGQCGNLDVGGTISGSNFSMVGGSATGAGGIGGSIGTANISGDVLCESLNIRPGASNSASAPNAGSGGGGTLNVVGNLTVRGNAGICETSNTGGGAVTNRITNIFVDGKLTIADRLIISATTGANTPSPATWQSSEYHIGQIFQSSPNLHQPTSLRFNAPNITYKGSKFFIGSRNSATTHPGFVNGAGTANEIPDSIFSSDGIAVLTANGSVWTVIT